MKTAAAQLTRKGDGIARMDRLARAAWLSLILTLAGSSGEAGAPGARINDSNTLAGQGLTVPAVDAPKRPQADNVKEIEPGVPPHAADKINSPAQSAAESHANTKVDPKTEAKVKELFSKAVQLLKENHAYEARAPLEEALRLAPRSAGIHCNLGLAYQNSGNIPRALIEFKQALSIRAHMPEATLNIAGCYQSMGVNDEAINWYTQYLTENPNTAQARQVQDIIKALEQALKRPGFDPRGEDYYQSITADGTYRWSPEKLPIRVFIDDAVKSDGNAVEGFRASFKPALISAFDSWAKAAGGRIDYRIVPTRDQADIYCSWTSDPAEVTENGTQSERGAAKIIVRGNNIERATLKILTKPVLEEAVLSDDELKKACLHEVGHVLGLQGHSTNNHDVMFYTVDTATVWPVLSKRDKLTISRLYDGYPVRSAAAAPQKQQQ